MNFHPIADIFPMMDAAAFEELAEDIKANGLLTSIVTYEEKILDGRNRFKACEKEGIEPRFEAYSGNDPLGYVISMNLQPRHLDESQRAMVAARVATMKRGDNQHAAIEATSQSEAAKRFNVSRSAVQQAHKVHEKGIKPLVAAVVDGKIAVSVAAKLADQDRKIQAEAVANPDRAAIIVKQKTRAGHEEAITHKILALPNKKYGLIYADPEWKFVPWSEETGNDRSPANHYATSMLDKIKERDVPSIAADDCVIFMWATVPLLPQAIEVMEHWGFTYKSHFIWLKNQIGTGYWNRNCHELMLIGTKGNIPGPAPGTQFDSAWDAPVGMHSDKPQIAYEIIEAYFPSLPRIELNKRGQDVRPGWSYWGAEAPLDLEADIPTERTRA